RRPCLRLRNDRRAVPGRRVYANAFRTPVRRDVLGSLDVWRRPVADVGHGRAGFIDPCNARSARGAHGRPAGRIITAETQRPQINYSLFISVPRTPARTSLE